MPNANPFGADNMFGYMNGKQMAWLSVLAFLFLYINLGSVYSHVGVSRSADRPAGMPVHAPQEIA